MWGPGDRFYKLADHYYGDARYWWIINYFNKNASTGRIDSARNYTAVGINLNSSNEWNWLRNNIANGLNEYVNRHESIQDLYFDWNIDAGCNIQKYNPGDAYSGEHMEHGPSYTVCRRVLGWMIYLNTIKHKGGTCWPQQKFTSKPREGDLYIWPAGWTHTHYGIAAPKECKYIITGWCSYDQCYQ